jgi:hypothetical protein
VLVTDEGFLSLSLPPAFFRGLSPCLLASDGFCSDNFGLIISQLGRMVQVLDGPQEEQLLVFSTGWSWAECYIDPYSIGPMERQSSRGGIGGVPKFYQIRQTCG